LAYITPDNPKRQAKNQQLQKQEERSDRVIDLFPFLDSSLLHHTYYCLSLSLSLSLLWKDRVKKYELSLLHGVAVCAVSAAS